MDRRNVLLSIVIVGGGLIGLAPSTNEARQQRITVPRPLPPDSYSRPPDASFDRWLTGDPEPELAIVDPQITYIHSAAATTRISGIVPLQKLYEMSSFYDKPGEFGYAIHGEEYGFDRLSFVLTETQPNGGPPLHTHTVEEGHVVLSGTITYVIGDRQVTAEGPYIARVPAGVAHTGLGDEAASVVGETQAL